MSANIKALLSEDQTLILIKYYIIKSYKIKIPKELQLIILLHLYDPLILDTLILTDKHISELLNMISNQLNTNKSFELKLLFRGSIHGNNAEAWHKKCNNIGNTITIVKSDYDYIFGGFTTIPWCNSSGDIIDNNAFIFTIHPNIKIWNAKKSKLDNGNGVPFNDSSVIENYGSVCHYNGFGPWFGGNAFLIYFHKQNYCSNDKTFNVGHGNILCGSNQTNSKSPDSTRVYFKVKELETFQVVCK